MADEIIHYRFTGIQLMSKSMIPMPSSGVGDKFLFDVQSEIKVNPEFKLVISLITITVRGGAEPIKLASMVVSCLFEIENFEDVILRDDKNQYIVPRALEATITPMSVSTVRGVLFSEFRGTYLNDAVLPIIYLNFQDKSEDDKTTKDRTATELAH